MSTYAATHQRLLGEARAHTIRSGGTVSQGREMVRDRVALTGSDRGGASTSAVGYGNASYLSQHHDGRQISGGGIGAPSGHLGGGSSACGGGIGSGGGIGKSAPNAASLLGAAGRYDARDGGRAGLFPVIDRSGSDGVGGDHGAQSHVRRRAPGRGPGSGTPPAYPTPSHANLPSPPPLPAHLAYSAHASSSQHGSAGSRSVPPGGANSRRHADPPGSGGSTGSRMSNNGRPPTPGSGHSLGLGGSGRREDLGSTPPLGRTTSNPGHSHLGTRDSLSQAAARSRSVVGGASKYIGNEGPNSSRDSNSSTCDKCDGRHPTDRCPHFNKDRERHKDAWVNYGRKGNPHSMGGHGGNFVLRSARVVRQPGDGSCLFHSLNHGLQQGGSAQSLRREIAGFLQASPKMEIAGDTIEEWVRWDSNSSVADYARRMAMSGWGGGIEMAACSILKHVNVHVYENARRGACNEFKRISCFDCPDAKRTIHVLYQGGVHYDALVPLSA